MELDRECVGRLYVLVRALPVYKGAYALLTVEQGEAAHRRNTRSLSQFVKRVRGK